MIDYGFHQEAAEELQAAVDYYTGKQADLGREFLNEVARAISLIRRFPAASPRVSPRSRRCRTRRFPYGLVYQERGATVVIIAVMELHRKPGYWIDREQ